jgi:repressor LexA
MVYRKEIFMSNLGNKKIFSENIKYYMNLFNKDRNKICRDLNFKYTTLTDWINGNVYPRIDKIEMLANYFGIPKSYLIESREVNTEIKEQEILKKTLVKAGLMKDNEDLSQEEFNELIKIALQIKNLQKKE